MTQVTRMTTGEVLIQLEGTFDAPAAREVRARLRALPADARVVVDFGRVGTFLDLGVAVMAPGLLEEQAGRVSVRGLRQHQHRLFRYFGVDLDTHQPAPVEQDIADAAG
jgi:STAS domain-containing protein